MQTVKVLRVKDSQNLYRTINFILDAYPATNK